MPGTLFTDSVQHDYLPQPGETDARLQPSSPKSAYRRLAGLSQSTGEKTPFWMDFHWFQVWLEITHQSVSFLGPLVMVKDTASSSP